ncbi:MAG TPA: SLBB domain-containing protein [Ignavibacteriaceae bacterium]|nr:SLBB domain-containing protein [Ignavibacteriaceae bacterium]
MKTALALFFTVFLLHVSLSAQNFPDYKERSFIDFSDSLLLKNRLSEIQPEATEGSIDPEEYISGPGDKIFISISGVEEIYFTLTVNEEGILYIPKVGAVDLKDKTLAAAKEKIEDKINRYYKNVSVFISLVGFRNIRISLVGNVKKPSSFTLPGNSRLIDLISASSGLNETANFRNISIKARSGKESSYDLIKFFRFGDRSQNPLLREGDIVLIDKVDKIVSVSGQVKFPGAYEFVEGESVFDLIEIAGGVLARARKDSVEIVRFDLNGKDQKSLYYSLEQLQNDRTKLHFGDLVLIREIPDYFIDKSVKIEGYVKYPGYYKIVEDKTTLSEIIKEAGGFRENASLTEASLVRSKGISGEDPEFERLKIIPRENMTDDEYDYFKAKSRQHIGKVVVDFEELFLHNNLLEDVTLKRGDVITVPEAKNYIILLGQVVNPGNIIYKEGLTVDDYIQLAGGFGWRAVEGEVRVIKAKTKEWVYADDVDSLEPGDTIWIPEETPGPKFWVVFTNVLTILGQVAAVVAATVAVIIATR